MKQEYIEAITEKLNECKDIALLDLIFQLLCKSIWKQNPAPGGNRERAGCDHQRENLWQSTLSNRIVAGFSHIFNRERGKYGNNQKTG